MTRVFIGGSRRVSRLDSDVRGRLDSLMADHADILIGDANGADKAVQRYLRECGYRRVEVFCVDGRCRNNLGDWPAHPVRPPHRQRDLAYYAAKDHQMAESADLGFMIRDMESDGTLLNVARLVEDGKSCVLYEVPLRRFRTIQESLEFTQILESCKPSARERVVRQMKSERRASVSGSQSSFL